MDGQEFSDESFGAKPAGDELPDHSWGLDRLGDYLRAEHDAIVQFERQSAAHYWRLGQALSLAYKYLGRSMRARFLAELGIHKVRACKARAIYRQFPSLAALGDRTIEDAYAEGRRERPTEESSQKKRRLPEVNASGEFDADELERFLLDVVEQVDALARATKNIGHDQRRRWRVSVRQTIDRLMRLERLLNASDEAESW